MNLPSISTVGVDHSSLPLGAWLQTFHSDHIALRGTTAAAATAAPPTSLPDLTSTVRSFPDHSARSAHHGLPTTPTMLTASARQPVWMTAALDTTDPRHPALVPPPASVSPPPAVSCGSPVVNTAMLNAAAAHLLATATAPRAAASLPPPPSPLPPPPPPSFHLSTTVERSGPASFTADTGSLTPHGSLFNPFEQQYLAEFLNHFTTDSQTASPVPEPSSTATSIHTAAIIPGWKVPKPDTSAGSGATTSDKHDTNTDKAYPSPEPSRSDSRHISVKAEPAKLAAIPTTEVIAVSSVTPAAVLPSDAPKPNKSRLSTPATRATKVLDSATPETKHPATTPATTNTRKRSADDTPRKARRKSIKIDPADAVVGDKPTTSPTLKEDGESATEIDPLSPSARKELLTEEQKRLNHIRSEQRRRDAIRTGFEDLLSMVPSLHDARLSKSIMLDEAAAWITKLEEDCGMLEAELVQLECELGQPPMPIEPRPSPLC